ncbi:MAG TPA: hypothetical protein VEK08_08340, partial [Planctomycetota bacterium]|nr:hypothetical protein [Planctomycetota bacterium]
MRRRVELPALYGWILLAGSLAAGEPYFLIDNFTVQLPGSNTVSCEVETKQPKVGLGAAQLSYRLDGNQRRAFLPFGEAYRNIPGAGTLKIWIKGDGSGNEMEFVLRHARTRIENDGRRVYFEHGHMQLPRIRLDFEDWREISLDARALPEGKVSWLESIHFHGVKPDPKKNPEPRMSGTVCLDDLRLYPSAAKPGAAFQSGLIGPAVRQIGNDLSCFVDVRSFSSKAARLRARLTVQDRNGNKVADRDFQLDVDAQASREFKLDLEPENVEAFLPPFTISGDVLSTDLAEVSATIEQPVVMGNAMLLFEDFSNVYGRWFTAGFSSVISANQRSWVEWTHGEGPRASTVFQGTAAISRVSLKADEAAPQMPQVPYAMQIDFSGEAAVYASTDRYLPGHPYRMGFWVKGDGSGAKLHAMILDYTNGADFWAGGWKRIYNGELQLCTLDFKEWRYIEVDLPGRGLGMTSPRGSTEAIDFPLELTAFRIVPVEPGKSGTVQIGPVFVHTQHAATSTLATSIGYDNPDFAYGAGHDAWVTIQNGWLSGQRKVRGTWTLLDRTNDTLASGKFESDIPARQTRVIPLPLKQHAAACAVKAGPFKLQVSVADSADPSISISRQVVITKAESRADVADFESERGYYGWKSGPQWTASTTAELAHGGKRSLKIAWDKEKTPQLSSAIDPPLHGVPTELSFFIHGDESGAIVYPVIGGITGVNHGANQSNFFLLRRMGECDLQNGVRLTW